MRFKLIFQRQKKTIKMANGAAAGQVMIEEGKIVSINNYSGHYGMCSKKTKRQASQLGFFV